MTPSKGQAMAFGNENTGRVSQSKYWALFGAYMVAIPVLLVGGFIAIFQGSFVLGVLMVIAIVPLGAYWRVIMMRRCRDIGWPAFLPWLIFIAQMFVSWGLPMSVGAGATPSMSLFLMPLLLGLADFVFSIVIGCVRGKQSVDYEAVFGDGPLQKTRPADTAYNEADEPDRFDDAIARALEAHRRGESVLGAKPAPRPAPALPGRPVGGFG